MKLSAWRDDVDIEDARQLLLEMEGDQADIWETVMPYLVPGHELKAQCLIPIAATFLRVLKAARPLR